MQSRTWWARPKICLKLVLTRFVNLKTKLLFSLMSWLRINLFMKSLGKRWLMKSVKRTVRLLGCEWTWTNIWTSTRLLFWTMNFTWTKTMLRWLKTKSTSNNWNNTWTVNLNRFLMTVLEKCLSMTWNKTSSSLMTFSSLSSSKWKIPKRPVGISSPIKSFSIKFRLNSSFQRTSWLSKLLDRMKTLWTFRKRFMMILMSAHDLNAKWPRKFLIMIWKVT